MLWQKLSLSRLTKMKKEDRKVLFFILNPCHRFDIPL